MDPFVRRKLGRSSLELPRLGFGGAALGNIFDIVTDRDAEATLEAAWAAGVRYYDTSPWYGRGLSERRIGSYLHGKPVSERLITTKVGRLFTAPADPAAFARSERAWPQGLHFEQADGMQVLKHANDPCGAYRARESLGATRCA